MKRRVTHYTIRPLYTKRAGLRMLSLNFWYFGVLFTNGHAGFCRVQLYKNYFEVQK